MGVCSNCSMSFESFLEMDAESMFQFLQANEVVLKEKECPKYCKPANLCFENGDLPFWRCRRSVKGSASNKNRG